MQRYSVDVGNEWAQKVEKIVELAVDVETPNMNKRRLRFQQELLAEALRRGLRSIENDIAANNYF